MVHIILVHTLWNFLKNFFHGSPNGHGSHKVCEPVNHGSHVTQAPKKVLCDNMLCLCYKVSPKANEEETIKIHFLFFFHNLEDKV
jgi:hypothetical protein